MAAGRRVALGSRVFLFAWRGRVLGLASPAFLFCSAAWGSGPADPVLEEADAAIGPSISDGVEPFQREVHDVAPERRRPRRDDLSLSPFV
jgi:hypothetical protein